MHSAQATLDLIGPMAVFFSCTLLFAAGWVHRMISD